MKKSLFFLFVLTCQISLGQSVKDLSGVILNEDGSPISNVHIQVEETNIGTVSNTQGIFNLKIPEKFCDLNLKFSHLGYQSISQKVFCEKKDHKVILTERTFELDEVQVSAMSAEQIVINAILNLDKNYQLDSVNYTIFSRLTEQIKNEPLLIEEFVYNLYHEDNTKPEFNIIKVRGYGFTKLGKQRFSEERLIGIHSTEGHLMLRFIPAFLKEKKMKKYEYSLIDEISDNGQRYYVIEITSTEYLKGGLIHVNQEDFGIKYLKKEYENEDWKDMSNSNNVNENYYIKDGDKWYFSHGSQKQTWYLKKDNIKIDSRRITVAINRSEYRSFHKRDEMGLMSKMLSEFKGRFDDDFWDAYNSIPLEDKFRRSLTDAKNP